MAPPADAARDRRLVDALPDAILCCDGDSIVFVNPAALRLLGTADERDLLGRCAIDLFDPDNRAAVRARIAGSDPASDSGIEARVARLDGVRIEVAVVAAATEGGEIQIVLRDITARRRRDAAL